MDAALKNRIQLAANAFEATDYWAKATTLTIELRRVAKRLHTTALEILGNGVRDCKGDRVDIADAADKAKCIRLLCAAAAGTLLRPGSRSSQLQLDAHREAGAFLVQAESKRADPILDSLQDRRSAAMRIRTSTAFSDFVMMGAAESHVSLGPLLRLMAMGPGEALDATIRRLQAASDKIAPRQSPPSGVLAAATGGNASDAQMFESSDLAGYIALESADRILKTEFARQAVELASQQAALQSSQDLERKARNRRLLDGPLTQTKLRSDAVGV